MENKNLSFRNEFAFERLRNLLTIIIMEFFAKGMLETTILRKYKIYSQFIFIASFLFISTTTFAQLNNISVGGGIGLGSIVGNLPTQTSFGGKLFIEAEPFIEPFNSLQFSFIYAQKLEKILPENRTNKYYPFVKGFSLTANSEQLLSENFFVGEGFGFLILNDRTFDDVNTWNYGLAINFFVGTKLSHKTVLSLNLDYGLTLTNTNASFILFILQFNYRL